MIKNEFKDNKPFKFPEEYAIRDEEEEKDTFFKHDLNRDINNNFTHEEKIKKQIEDAYEKYHEEMEIFEFLHQIYYCILDKQKQLKS